MKRIIFCLFCSLFSLGAFAQPDIRVGIVPTVVKAGSDEVVLEFELNNPDQQIIAGEMNIILPEGIAVIDDDGFLVDMDQTRTKRTKHVISGSYKDGAFKVLFYSSENKFLLGTEGTVFTLSCSVSPTVQTGLLPVALKDISFSWGEGATERFDLAESVSHIRVEGNETANVTIPEGGVATLCLPFAAELKAGMKAFKATGIKNGAVELEEQTTIPANTPLIIFGAAGTYNFSGDNSGATEASCVSGVLTGFLFPTDIEKGHVLQRQAKGLGFYKVEARRNIPAYRCVIDESQVAKAPAFLPLTIDGESTGIGSIMSDGEVPDNCVTLDGKKVSSPTRGNSYIINGKKVFIK